MSQDSVDPSFVEALPSGRLDVDGGVMIGEERIVCMVGRMELLACCA